MEERPMAKNVGVHPEKILIIRLSAIGDVLRTLPALRVLRENLPRAYIAWVVEEKSKDVLEGHPDLNRLIIFPRERWTKYVRSPSTVHRPFLELTPFIRSLQEENFDLVLDFHGLFKSGLIGYVSGAELRVGFHRTFSKELNFLFNNRHVKPSSKKLGRIERNLTLLSFLNLKASGVDPIIPAHDDDVRAVDAFFQEHLPSIKRPLIAIHPGTSAKTKYKRWPFSRFARLADRLIEECGACILFTWGPGELEGVREVRSMMHHPALVACETGNLRQLAELFRRCALYVGGDTGPMHLAAFVKTPVVGIFGPTDPVVNAPYGESWTTIVRKDVECSPCRDRDCERLACLDAISYEDVFRVVKNFMDGHGQSFSMSTGTGS
jgi:lipopolysaccharide heptosyltransferase I